MATELDERCPICLDSWEEASYVMPCLHQFCFPCIQRWAESKPECPLCKRRVLSIVHSVRADDDFEELVITPSVTPPVVRQAGRAPSHPATHNLHHPRARQRWAAEGVPRSPGGGLQLPNWLNCFQDNPALLQNLQNLVCQELEEMYDSRAHRLRGWQGARAAGGQEGSLAGAPGPTASRGGSPGPGPAPPGSPARPSTDEPPSTSSAAVGGGPGSHPSAPVAIPMEQEEPQEEPGEAVPSPSASSRGRERSPGGPRRPPKRRSSSSEASSPATKRPAPPR